MRIAKAHGLGNDFLIVSERDAPADPAAWARRLCDRHRGVGADGVLLYGVEGDALSMRLVNADGGFAEISGNGLRCLSAFAVSRGLVADRHVVHTAAGARTAAVRPSGLAYRVEVDLGVPILDSASIPIVVEPPRTPVVGHALQLPGREVVVTATSMGNPHCAVFVDAPPDDATVGAVGAALERHPAFPRRTNVEFVTVVGRGELRVRFWERGVGPTSASGTGAASAAVAAILNGRVDRTVRVVCDGGVLDVEWPENGSVRQAGDVELLFEGHWVGPAD
jgi:diaminopimelate epimerase